MDLGNFYRQINILSDERLQELIQDGLPPALIEFIENDLEQLKIVVQLLKMGLLRVWSELEGHQDLCTLAHCKCEWQKEADEHYWEEMKRFTMGFSYQPKPNGEQKMDKKIKKIEKEMKGLEKADKKRDKVCDYGTKMMKKAKKK